MAYVVIVDSRTLQSTPESGHRAGFDGAKKRRGSKVHAAVDTMGHVLALLVTPAAEQDRNQVYNLCHQIQEVTGDHVDIVLADGGYTGEQAETDAALLDVELVVVKRPTGAKGFVLLPRQWIIERNFAWSSCFRRLGRDLERLPSTLLGFHRLAFAVLSGQKLLA